MSLGGLLRFFLLPNLSCPVFYRPTYRPTYLHTNRSFSYHQNEKYGLAGTQREFPAYQYLPTYPTLPSIHLPFPSSSAINEPTDRTTYYIHPYARPRLPL